MALAHAETVRGYIIKKEKILPRITYNGKSGYKRDWGHFWRSLNENEAWRWRTKYKGQPDKYSGIKYNKPLTNLAGRKSTEHLTKKFATKSKKQAGEVIVRNNASYAGHVIGNKKDQSNHLRRIGHVGIEEASYNSKYERARITDAALKEKARKAGGV